MDDFRGEPVELGDKDCGEPRSGGRARSAAEAAAARDPGCRYPSIGSVSGAVGGAFGRRRGEGGRRFACNQQTWAHRLARRRMAAFRRRGVSPPLIMVMNGVHVRACGHAEQANTFRTRKYRGRVKRQSSLAHWYLVGPHSRGPSPISALTASGLDKRTAFAIGGRWYFYP